jgi:hypothetical protein
MKAARFGGLLFSEGAYTSRAKRSVVASHHPATKAERMGRLAQTAAY